MANAYSTNYVLFAVGETFNAIWKLTRTAMAAGWKYKASGNGQSSGSWNAAQTGTTVTASSFTTPALTLTGLQGMSPGVVGQWITLTGFTGGSTGNNGTFLILSYISSSSVTVYNTSGVGSGSGTNWNLLRDSALDLWGVGGYLNLTNVSGGGSGSGTGVSIGAASASTGQSTITGVTSFSQSASPGRVVTITGSALGNNGSFRILSATAAGTSVTIYAPGFVAETTNASLTVTEQYGGTAASITTFTTTTSGQSTLINVTGLSGLSASDIGRKIRFLNPSSTSNLGSFTIVSVGSSSTATVYGPFASANDANNGSIQWVEWDPLQQTYPSSISGANGAGCWQVMEGPTIMKIPIGSNVASGTFIRGENLTQTSTGAQGELLGYVPDPNGGTGFLVVAPRVIGTGGNAGPATGTNMTYGWNNITTGGNTDTVTGGTSTATITTTNTSTTNIPIAYIREMMIWKNTATNGHMFHQCIDQNPNGSEAATTAATGRFSIMASTLSQISAVIGPATSTGGNVSTNGFPTTNQGAGSYIGTYVVFGEGGTGSTSTGDAQWTVVTPTSPGRAQILCANNIEQQLVSADGTWGYYQSCNSTGYQGLGYHRLDNGEDGDVDPYIHQGPFGSPGTNNSPARQNDAAGTGSGSDNMNTAQLWFDNPGFKPFKGFYRRGLNIPASYKTTEYYSYFGGALLYDVAYSGYLTQLNSGNPDQVGTAPSGTTIYVREPVWVYLTGFSTQNNGVRMRKGTPRWLFLMQGGSVNSTLDSKQWLILSGSSTTQTPFVAGPYDGATTPSF